VRAETDDAQAFLDRLWKQTQRAQARHLLARRESRPSGREGIRQLLN
jgi:hypothetical protein